MKSSLLNPPSQRGEPLAKSNAPKPSSQPTSDAAASKRRLDFQSVRNGGPHSLSQPTSSSSRDWFTLPEEEDDAVDDEVNNFVEESMAMLNEEYDLSDQQEDDSPSDPEPAPISKRRPGTQAAPQPKEKPKAAPANAAPTKRSARPVIEEEEEEEEEAEVQGQEPDEDDEEEERQATPPPKSRRGPAAKGKAPAAAPAHGPNKRRSLEEENGPSPEPQPKRQRTEASKKPEPKPKVTTKRVIEPPPEQKSAKKGRPKASEAHEPGDVSQVMTSRRPPLPKSRGLLINRRTETLNDPSSGMFRTRSGRTSFKPLAYWRNERVEYEKDESLDPFVGRGGKSSAPKKFVLPVIKEVVRVEEAEPEVRRRSGGGRKGKRSGGRKRRSRSEYEESDDDEGPADSWEVDPGYVTGEVVVWQPEYEWNPPAPNDLVSVMDKQLAISAQAIKTTEVVGGEFRYAKVFSEGFIGAGVVDLPPGAVKRLKNSRKVFMIFFVHKGRVLVTVQETSFRISKGGIFIVPRCKFSPISPVFSCIC